MLIDFRKRVENSDSLSGKMIQDIRNDPFLGVINLLKKKNIIGKK